MRELTHDDLTERLEAFTGRQGLRGAVEIAHEKLQTLADFWPLVGPLLDGPVDDPAARERWLGHSGRETLAAARQALATCPGFDTAAVEDTLRRVVRERGARPKDIFQPLRVALTGTTVSPGIFETIAFLGREETLARVDAALAERDTAGGA
jgi:glutamyl-tRNA synthetase